MLYFRCIFAVSIAEKAKPKNPIVPTILSALFDMEGKMQSLPGQTQLTQFLDAEPLSLPMHAKTIPQAIGRTLAISGLRILHFFIMAMVAVASVAGVGLIVNRIDPSLVGVTTPAIYGYVFATASITVLRSIFVSRILRWFDPVLTLMYYGCGLLVAVGLIGLLFFR